MVSKLQQSAVYHKNKLYIYYSSEASFAIKNHIKTSNILRNSDVIYDHETLLHYDRPKHIYSCIKLYKHMHCVYIHFPPRTKHLIIHVFHVHIWSLVN
jgi:hypothetical protein